jgi:hypothetical protein
VSRINKLLIGGIMGCVVIGLVLAGLIHWTKRPIQIHISGQPGEIRAVLDGKNKPLTFSNKPLKGQEKGK